jgi:hypothetical protein
VGLRIAMDALEIDDESSCGEEQEDMEERKRRPWTREVGLGSPVLAVPRGLARSRRFYINIQMLVQWSSQQPSSAMHSACVSRLASLGLWDQHLASAAQAATLRAGSFRDWNSVGLQPRGPLPRA